MRGRRRSPRGWWWSRGHCPMGRNWALHVVTRENVHGLGSGHSSRALPGGFVGQDELAGPAPRCAPARRPARRRTGRGRKYRRAVFPGLAARLRAVLLPRIAGTASTVRERIPRRLPVSWLVLPPPRLHPPWATRPRQLSVLARGVDVARGAFHRVTLITVFPVAGCPSPAHPASCDLCSGYLRCEVSLPRNLRTRLAPPGGEIRWSLLAVYGLPLAVPQCH